MSNAVPDGWQIKKLGSLVDPRSSNVDKKTDPGEIPVRLCNYTDVYYKNRITSDIDFMKASAKQREIDRFSLEKGDVIITKDSETPSDIAVPAYVCEDLNNVVCGYHLTLLKPHMAESDGEFLSHLFQLPSVQHYFYVLANGITRFGLTADAISEAPLLTPPLPEQQKIAAILSSVDDVIEKTRAQIDKLKDLKTGMMQELLTKGIGHTEFKDSPVGRIPASWSVIELKQIAAVKGGKRMPKGKPFAGHVTPHPYIRVSDLGNGTIRQDNLKYVLPKDREAIKRYTISKNDLYISIAGTIGMVGSVPETLDGAQLTENAAKIVFYDLRTLCPSFVKHVLTSGEVQERLNQEKGTGGGVPKLALFRIESTQLPMPPLSEQRSIGKALDAMDQRLTVTHEKLIALMNCKKALMQDLLTGKVRVKVDQKESTVA
jgi:type I restriction enzyme S subunit